MHSRLVSPIPTALALLLLAGSLAHADFAGWSYNWTHSPGVVAADAGGTGGITMTNQQGTMVSFQSDIVAAQLTTFSSASASAPDRFTNRNYRLTLAITDLASHQSSLIPFNGVFNGTLSTTNANITNTFTGLLAQEVLLGGNTFYTVTIGAYAAPGIPDATQSGSISAHVLVVIPPPDALPGNGPDSPEPPTIFLAGVGVSALALAGWRQRARERKYAVPLSHA
jgi:hypothetical protein